MEWCMIIFYLIEFACLGLCSAFFEGVHSTRRIIFCWHNHLMIDANKNDEVEKINRQLNKNKQKILL